MLRATSLRSLRSSSLSLATVRGMATAAAAPAPPTSSEYHPKTGPEPVSPNLEPRFLEMVKMNFDKAAVHMGIDVRVIARDQGI